MQQHYRMRSGMLSCLHCESPVPEQQTPVQGRCTSPPPGGPPPGYKPGQCLVITPKQFLTTAGRDSAILLSNLHVQLSAGKDDGFDDGFGFETLVLAQAGSTLWMTNVTLSGCAAGGAVAGERSRVAEGGQVQPGGGCGRRGRGLHSIASRVLLAGAPLPPR